MTRREDELTFQMEKASDSLGVVVAVLRDMAECGDSTLCGNIEGVKVNDALYGCVYVLESVRGELKAAMFSKEADSHAGD